MDFYHSELFSYVILPFLIFIARISDVTIGTVRIVMVAKGAEGESRVCYSSGAERPISSGRDAARGKADAAVRVRMSETGQDQGSERRKLSIDN
jgi:hypothetical protein